MLQKIEIVRKRPAIGSQPGAPAGNAQQSAAQADAEQEQGDDPLRVPRSLRKFASADQPQAKLSGADLLRKKFKGF